MPRSKVKKSKLFREVSKLHEKYVSSNHLKNLRSAWIRLDGRSELGAKDIMFMLYVYDLEFFTLSWAAENYQMNRNNMANRIVYPLLKEGYIYKHFDKLTPSGVLEDHLFRDETKHSYHVRYALSQKGRIAVQRFYQSLTRP